MAHDEAQCRLLVENATDYAIFFMDPDGRITDWNSGAERITGYSLNEVLGQPGALIFSPDDRAQGKPQQELENARAHGSAAGERWYLRKDGSRFWGSGTTTSLRDEAGALLGFAIVVRDETERQRTSEALRNERDFTTAVMDTTGYLVIVVDRAGNIVRFNRACEQVSGYSFEEVRGRNALDLLLTPEDAAGAAAILQEVFSGQFPNTYDCYWLARDGSRHLIAWSNTALLDDTGAVEYVVGTGLDVTERKTTEESQHQSSQFLESVLDALSAHIAVLDENGCVIAANQAWQSFAQGNSGAVGGIKGCTVGANYLNACDGATGESSEDAAAIAQGIRDVISGRRANFTLEYPYHGPAQERWFYLRVSRLKSGTQVQVVVSHHDVTGHKLAEVTLAQSERQFRAVFDNTLDAIVISDNDGRFVEVNEAACQIYETPRDQLLRKEFKDFVSPGWDQAAAIREFRAAGRNRGEFQIHLPGGGKKYIEFAATADFLPGRHLTAVRDITQRKEAEAALRESVEFQRVLLANFPNGSVNVFDRDLRYVMAAGRGLEDAGLTPEQLIGKSLDEVFPQEVAALAKSYYAEAFEGKMVEFDLSFQKRLNHITTVPLRNQQQEVIALLAVVQDITERKQSEQALYETREQLRIVTENARVGLVIVDRDHRYTFVNSAYAEIFDIPSAEIVGQRVADYHDAIYEEQIRPRLDRAFAGERVAYELHRPSNGKERYFAVRYEPTLVDGEVSLVVAVITDITESRLAEAAVRASEAKLAEAQRMAHLGNWEWDLTAGDDWSANQVFWSDETFRLLGYEPGRDTASYENFIRRISNTDHERMKALAAESLRDKKPYSYDHAIILPDGSQRLLHQQAEFIFDDCGHPIRMVGTMQDVTESRLAEAKVREGAERLAGIVDAAMDAIISINTNQEITLFNPAAEKMFGFKRDEILGQRVELLIPERFRATHAKYVREFSESGMTSRKMDRLGVLSGLRSNGEEFPIEASISQVEIDGEKLLTVILRDITERRMAELASSYYASIAESSDDAFIGMAVDGTITRWNTGAEKLLGYKAAEIIGQPYDVLVPPDRQQQYYADKTQHLVSGQDALLDKSLLRKDGTLVEASIRLSLVRDASGEVVGRSALARDITERKRAEKALQASEERFRSTLDNMIEGCQLIGSDWRYLYINRAAAEHGRRPAEEFVGRTIQEARPGIENTHFFARLKECMSSRVPEQFENEFVYADGSSAWFQVIMQPVPEGVFILTMDITERKRAVEAQARLAAIVESSEDAIFSRDLEGVITSWNQGAEKLFGFTAVEMVGQHLSPIFPPDLANEEWEIIGTLRHGECIQNYETKRLCKNGDIVLVSLSGAPLYNSSGEIVGISTILRDISAQKQAAQELQKSLSLLQATLESTADGILVIDASDNVTHFNQKYLEMWDVSPDIMRLPGQQRFAACAHRLADAVAVLEATSRIDSNPDLVAQDLIHFNDGRVFERYSQPQRVEGRSLGRVWSFRDVTERFRAEAAQAQLNELLDSQRRRLNEILSNVPGIVWENRINPDTGQQQSVYVSEYIETMLGYNPQEWLESPDFWLSIVHPDDLAATLQQVMEMMAHQRNETFLYRMIARDGRVVWTESHCTIIFNEKHEVVGLYGVTMDITHRMEAQEEQSRLAALLESTTDLVAWTDSDILCRYINPAGRVMLGLDPNESVEGREISDFLPAKARELIWNEALPTAAAQGSWSGEGAILSRGGREIPVSQVVMAHKDPLGNLLFYSTIARDISDRKMAEAALQKYSNELEDRVLARTQELAAMNREFQAQIAERQMAVSTLKNVVVELENSQAATEMANAELKANEAHLLRGNRIFMGLARIKVTTEADLSSVVKRLTVEGSKLLNTARCSAWLYNGSRDSITCLDLYDENTQMHSQGTELAARDYPAYFEALQVGILVAEDAHSHPATSEFSEGYLSPLGIGAMLDVPVHIGGQLVGVICFEHVGGPRQWKVAEQTFARSSAAIYALALEALERARTTQALHEAKEEADRARREAEAANLAKSEFLSRMSHELRTPLNAILGFGQVLELDDLPPKRRENVQHILKAGHHLLELINEVLDISRIEAGNLQLSLEPVRVTSTIREVLDMVRPLASSGNIELINRVPQSSELYTLADSQRLKQGLLNLVSNAIKYNRAGGSVTIVAEPVAADDDNSSSPSELTRQPARPDGEAKRLRLSITDTGLGLSEHEIARLFTPFERLSAAKSRIEGTGIGLVLTRRLIEAMGGSIGVYSTPGTGSTFWIELRLVPSPLDSLRNSSDQEDGTALATVPGETKTVLYIEDNLANLQLVETILQSRPTVHLLTAMQGSTGLDLAFEHRPDLILLDLHLPDINGDEVLRRLLSNPVTGFIPVVIISADATPGQIERLLSAGASSYLTKPFNVKQLLQILDDNLYAKE